MSALDALKLVSDLSDLALLLNCKPAALSYIIYKQPDANKYKTFEIPKRNGGKRTIKAPSKPLKHIQQRLSILLQDCLDDIETSKGGKDRVAHGFKRERSIRSNAKEHRNRRYVFNIDLENFFPSINFGRVRGYFMRDKNFALSDKAATVIAQIACHENSLPQGSPCSPVVSNLIAHILDIHLVRIAQRVGCTYTRYADDLTFSTNKKSFPKEIAETSPTDLNLWLPGTMLQKVVSKNGFTINTAKTNMQYRDSRQEVTGLIVNRKINVRREYRHASRSMVHSLLNKGYFEILAANHAKVPPVMELRKGSLNELHGILGFIDRIDTDNRQLSQDKKKRGNEKRTESSREVLYRDFLLYENFFAAENPVVLCEGETDNIYLTHAIRGLAAFYPQLAKIDASGKIALNVRLYKYRKSSTARILGLKDGGSSALADFVNLYKKRSSRFNAPGQSQPIIVLYDNDDGGTSFQNGIKHACASTPNFKGPFVHVFGNLYAVGTPLPLGALKSKIEDLFEPSVLATKVDGKSFNDSNHIDPTIHYGKKVFAYKVVRPDAQNINFDGFKPVLKIFADIIQAHANKMNPFPTAVTP